MENILDKKLKTVLVLLAVCGSVFFVTKAITEIGNYRNIGSSANSARISFSGKGEVKIVPDIANIYFIVSETKKTQSEAEQLVSTKTNAILDYLRNQKVDDKDLKIENNSTNQNYDYSGSVGAPEMMYPYPGKPVANGFTSTRSISVKIRNTDKDYIGKIVAQLNKLGVTDMNGPNFVVDNQDKYQEQARLAAIKDAKANAQKMASAVGLKLGKIIDFQESGNYPMPYARAGAVMMDAKAENVVVGDLPKGEDTITSNVTIIYEIR